MSAPLTTESNEDFQSLSDRRLRHLFSEENRHNLTPFLFESVRKHKSKDFLELIYFAKKSGNSKILLRHSHDEESLLHAVVKMRTPHSVVSALITACPDLLLEFRQNSEVYRGQSAIHIAITEGDSEVVNTLLCHADALGAHRKTDVLHCAATGSRFENTVMLGELPLTVAALTLNTNMMDLLLKHNAELDRQNSSGDTVCHSLIRYAHLYPEKLTDIMKVCEHITNCANISGTNTQDIGALCSREVGQQFMHVWLLDNDDGVNPLRLAASLGQHDMFRYLMELRGVYCYLNSDDGLFDIQLYDVTEIDDISTATPSPTVSKVTNTEEDIAVGIRTPKSTNLRARQPPPTTPVLETIFSSDPLTVFRFIELSPLRYVIGRKWPYYRWYYLGWAVLHIMFMIGYSVYAVERSELHYKYLNRSDIVSNHQVNKLGDSVFVTFYAYLSLFVAIIYILQEVLRFLRGRMPWTLSHLMNCYHNGPFRIVLMLFSVCVLGDLVWSLSDETYEYYLLVCAMILGWWFIVFFLRGVKQFSFFTVMIQKVLVGDMFRFSIIIGMELIAFTTAMFIAFRGSKTLDDNVEDYGKLMVLMFKMMFGFTSIDVLFEARRAWFAVGLYTAFVLLTYVLMVNSLIAMMSNTCSVVSANRDMQYRVQQLSIVLFLESVLPPCCLRDVGSPRQADWFDSETRRYGKKRRYFMEVRSLHEVTKSKSRLHVKPDSMLATIFHKLSAVQLPRSGLFASAATVTKEDKGTTIDDINDTNSDVYPTTGERKPTKDSIANNINVTGMRRKKSKRKSKKQEHTTGHSVLDTLSTSLPPTGSSDVDVLDGTWREERHGAATLEIHQHPHSHSHR